MGNQIALATLTLAIWYLTVMHLICAITFTLLQVPSAYVYTTNIWLIIAAIFLAFSTIYRVLRKK